MSMLRSPELEGPQVPQGLNPALQEMTAGSLELTLHCLQRDNPNTVHRETVQIYQLYTVSSDFYRDDLHHM